MVIRQPMAFPGTLSRHFHLVPQYLQGHLRPGGESVFQNPSDDKCLQKCKSCPAHRMMLLRSCLHPADVLPSANTGNRQSQANKQMDRRYGKVRIREGYGWATERRSEMSNCKDSTRCKAPTSPRQASVRRLFVGLLRLFQEKQG